MLGNKDATATIATRREGDVHISGHMKIAWFKDPDGNILNIVSG